MYGTNYMQRVIFSAGRKMLIHTCFILFSIISSGIVLVLILPLNMASADQSYFEPSIKTVSSDVMSGMSNNMSDMKGMSGMSNNMSDMKGMSGMSNNMSDMKGMPGMGSMSRMLGISSNEEVSIFLEWIIVLIVVLIGAPFAWVFLSEKRKKKYNRTNTAPK
jgi:hypothetical protein